jgi:hypothetical protein
VKQIDFTQDVKGFFASFDVNKTLASFASMVGLSKTRDYKSFATCVQLTDCEGSKRKLRFKFYNKPAHWLTSEQGKKKVSMNLKAMLLCSNISYQKYLECENAGMSRIEFSCYCDSVTEQIQRMNVATF